ncbi:hypothetical protein [Pandoravirus japonicus]|uniref:Uncharacterized protein n=1 Tax=Pandoravirus japonicus TaxID=2823154 RepID=A0A811BL64_9VIRU|nr:hypothetical protein [Pandoravirus japonicus]
MGARMTAGLPAYDASTDEAPADTAHGLPPGVAGDDDAPRRPGADAADTLRSLYRRPQVHFCCTAAAMRRIEALASRLPIDHVCAPTRTSAETDGGSWWVAMSPRSYDLLLASRVLVEVDRRRLAAPSHSPWLDHAPRSPPLSAAAAACADVPPRVDDDEGDKYATPNPVAPMMIEAPAKTTTTTTTAAMQKAAGPKPTRRRRRRRGGAKLPAAERTAVAPLSV